MLSHTDSAAIAAPLLLSADSTLLLDYSLAEESETTFGQSAALIDPVGSFFEAPVAPRTMLTAPQILLESHWEQVGQFTVGTDSSNPADPLFSETTIGQIWAQTQAVLADFWQTGDRSAAMAATFGSAVAPSQTASVVDQLISQRILPKLEVLPQRQLQAQGAYAAETDTIFLAKELFGQPEKLLRVVLEELGHFIDDHTGPQDAPGDEGALFAAHVLGDDLSATAIAALKAEDDTATLTVDGQPLAVEQASFGTGHFTVAANGQVAIEFLADSGAYEGQLAVFSLTGMAGLTPGTPEFIQEAARRALSNSPAGYIVINDQDEGASLTGELGESDRNSGRASGVKIFNFDPGSAVAVMLVPDGSVQAVFETPTAEGRLRPLFSLAAANPANRVHLGEVRPGIFAMEDVRFDAGSDADFNDVIFRLQGVTGQVEPVTNLIGSRQIWVDSPLGQQLFLISDEALGNPVFMASNNPILPPVNAANLQVAFPTSGTPKFTASNTEADIAATGAARITIGTQTVYIGTNQVTAINQNPIVASFDSVNPANNWIRTDLEVTGADGKGLGLAWDGNSLYGVFTVDGTQGTPAQDFRRVSNEAEQAWLRTYGQGGGPAVSVLARIDAATGELLDAAYLSAVLSNGNSNTLRVQDVAANASGNLVVNAQSFFSPRRPDGSALTPLPGVGSSPFAYTIEITPDLKRVVSTASPGWT